MNSTTPRGITFQPDIYPKVLALLPREREARIVDVGAGEGYFCDLLLREGYRNVAACDYLPGNFKVPNVPFHQADFNKGMPFPDQSLDVAVSIEVLEHLENHFIFLRELLRVLRPGGIAILTTPNILSITSRLHFFLYGYTDCAPRPLDPTRAPFMQHINPIGVPQLLYLAERFGGEMVGLTTNRIRRSTRCVSWLLIPLFRLALKAKLMRAKYADCHDLYRRHLNWVVHPANLTGRITIAVIRRKMDSSVA